MPRYFFDVLLDDRFCADEEGTVLDDEEAAKFEATQAMAEVARDSLRGADSKGLKMTVRNDAGVHLFELELHFSLFDMRS